MYVKNFKCTGVSQGFAGGGRVPGPIRFGLNHAVYGHQSNSQPTKSQPRIELCLALFCTFMNANFLTDNRYAIFIFQRNNYWL